MGHEPQITEDEIDFFVKGDNFLTEDIPNIPQRNKIILFERIYKQKTFKDIGTKFNISGSRCRQVFLNSLRKVCHYLILRNKGIKNCSFEHINIPTRIRNVLFFLEKEGITKLQDLNGYPIEKLLKISNLGEKSVVQLQEYLIKHGLSLNLGEIPYELRKNKSYKRIYIDLKKSLKCIDQIFELMKNLDLESMQVVKNKIEQIMKHTPSDNSSNA